jgi:hypothetical protein
MPQRHSLVAISKSATTAPEQIYANAAAGAATQDGNDPTAAHPKTKSLDPENAAPNVARWIYPGQSETPDDEDDPKAQELLFQWVAY